MKEHWPRWIYASFSKQFKASLEADSLKVFVEGTDRDSDALGLTHVEFRMDGPRLKQLPANEYRVWVAVNILFKVDMDTNFHVKHDIVGKIVKAFTDTVSVFRLGTGADDDQSLLGCFVTDKTREDGLQVNHFGQIEKEIRVEQGTVEGHYVAYLTETT